MFHPKIELEEGGPVDLGLSHPLTARLPKGEEIEPGHLRRVGLQHPPLGWGKDGISCAARDSATSQCLSMDLPPREPAGVTIMPGSA